MKKLATKVVGCVLAAMMLVQPVSTVVGNEIVTEAQAASYKTGYIKSAVNLRKSASTSSAVVKVLTLGEKVSFADTNKTGWYKVKVGTKTGYVGKAYVTYTKPQATTVKQTVTTTVKTGWVTASSLVVRKKASSSAAKVMTLKKNAQVTITGTSGSWYKISCAGKTGYIQKAYISTSSKVVSSDLQAKTTGQKVVNYALKFVGNRYVYGGTSLTAGTDCSGFTMGVYKNFGYNLPRTSTAQRSSGRAVASLAQAQAGDLIFYSGHVAIYMGNNKIVHAANSRRGIVAGDSATCMKIIGIRRIV
ncbi:MAG: C40 family peptidase [Lachnospiraceae bacterium]